MVEVLGKNISDHEIWAVDPKGPTMGLPAHNVIKLLFVGIFEHMKELEWKGYVMRGRRSSSVPFQF